MSTRRTITDRIAAVLVPLYGEREARSIAQLAAAGLSGLTVSALLTDPSAPLAIEGLDGIIERLAAGEPVQYLLGRTEFYGREFVVRQGVLIPRPETEELVAWVVKDRPQAILDVGTGSGCIAATLALELPEANVSAADISDAALTIAAENFHGLDVRVDLRKAEALNNLSDIFPGPFDAVVSNPPYVPQSDLTEMHRNVRNYEPHEALFVPDDDPLLFYRAIACAGRRMLRPGGKLYFEIYHTSADAMRTMLTAEGYTDTEIREDIYGKPRMSCSRLK